MRLRLSVFCWVIWMICYIICCVRCIRIMLCCFVYIWCLIFWRLWFRYCMLCIKIFNFLRWFILVDWEVMSFCLVFGIIWKFVKNWWMFLELILRMILSFILLIVWYKNFCWKLVLVFGRMCLWMKRDFCIDMEKILEVGKFVFFDFLINFYFWVIKFSIDFILMFLYGIGICVFIGML